MEGQKEFITYLLELFGPLGLVKAKAMFGGFGIYLNDIIFGLVAQDEFSLNVDDENRLQFKVRGLEPFTYERKWKEFSMSYYKTPYKTIDNAEKLYEWEEKAYEVAVRSALIKNKKKAKIRRKCCE